MRRPAQALRDKRSHSQQRSAARDEQDRQSGDQAARGRLEQDVQRLDVDNSG